MHGLFGARASKSGTHDTSGPESLIVSEAETLARVSYMVAELSHHGDLSPDR